MPTFEVMWPTIKGELAVRVAADISEDGQVTLKSVTNPAASAIYFPNHFQTAERLALYDVVRKAAGICTRCCGSKKLVTCQRVRGKQEEFTERCPQCQGTGREPQ